MTGPPEVDPALVRAAQHGDQIAVADLMARFDVVLRPGWCVMQSRFLIGGMAAAPEADGTRFAFLGGLRLPGMRLLDPLLGPVTRPLALRPIRRLEHRLRDP